MIWSDAQIERVKSLADAGMSAAQIAAELGDVTRNAVVGIGFRHGFRFHGTSGSASRQRKPKAARSPQVNVTLVEAPPPRTGMLTIHELQADSCRWPCGDPLDPSFRFCGQWKPDGTPYCGPHRKISYESPEQRHARIQF